jgi:signal transduction histidine kinase/CHASE2 domain-containing sensor protein
VTDSFATLRWRLLLAAIVASVVAAASFDGRLHNVNNQLRDLMFVLAPAPAPGDAIVIAIDSRSLQAERAWPWSRARYGELLDRLEGAGVRQLAFDIDFSSPGQGDERFAEALSRAEFPVTLAAFRQAFDGMPGVYAEMKPNEALRPHVDMASTVFPVDMDGVIRRIADHEPFSDGTMPQLAFALNGKAVTGRRALIDFSGDPGNIPVVSFQDVLDGRVAPEAFTGRTVFIGATAKELGDEFALPLYGLRSGVLLNALAYEEVARDGLLSPLPWWTAMLLMLAALGAAIAPIDRLGLMRYLGLQLSAMLTIFGAGWAVQLFGNTVLLTAEAQFAHLVAVALIIIRQVDVYAGRIFRSGMHVRKQAQILDALMSDNHAGLIVTNRFGEVESCNRKAAGLAGLSVEAITGMPLRDCLPDVVRLCEAGRRGEVVEFGAGEEQRFVDVSWSVVTLPVAKSRYEKRKEERELTVITLHDVTVQIRSERAERAAKLVHAEASAAKSTLIATMSHELRTPLNGIIGFADLIASESFGKIGAPEYAEYAGTIGASGKQLLAVVNDMLLAAKLQSGDVEFKPARLSLRDLCDAALAKASQKGDWTSPNVELELPRTPINVDRDLMMTALQHLLDNASKFGGADATVRVSLEIDGSDAVLTVADDGPGTEATPAELVELFRQGDGSRNRAHEGCGLGLYLVDRVARLAGGSLRLDSAPGEGFRARIMLPGAAVPAADKAAA